MWRLIDFMKKNKNTDDMSVGFITFEKHNGRKDIGSSTIRAEWLCNHWDNAEIFKQGRNYDVILFQKAYWVDMAKDFKGIKIFDICDADFLHWGYRTKEMLVECDAVTTSTEALAEQFRRFTDKPVVCIPDRIDLDLHNQKKLHKGRATHAVWYGYSDNFEMLDPVMYFLEKFGLDLIVISNKPYLPQMNYVKPEIQKGMNINDTERILEMQKKKEHWVDVKNVKWTKETVDKDIISGDIVINPTKDAGKWKYKSNNKTIKSWALGLPVASNTTELKLFLEEGARQKEVEKRQKEIKDKWDVKLSIEQYKKLFKKIQND